MTDRKPSDRPPQDLTEAEARRLAADGSPWPIAAGSVRYRWGWVFGLDFGGGPAPAGPGPVSVTLRGKVIRHGSLPYPFSDDEEPIDRFAASKSPGFWARLVASLGL